MPAAKDKERGKHKDSRHTRTRSRSNKKDKKSREKEGRKDERRTGTRSRNVKERKKHPSRTRRAAATEEDSNEDSENGPTVIIIKAYNQKARSSR